MTYEDAIQRRAPCGGWSNYSPISVGCGGIFSTASVKVPAYVSDTSRSMYDGTVEAFGVQPEPNGRPSCASGGGGTTCDAAGLPPCGPFLSSNNPACTGGDVVVSTGDYPWSSCFKPQLDATGSQVYIDLSGNCQPKLGFMQVQAYKYHHGILSPTSEDSQPYDGLVLDANFQCGYCNWQTAHTTCDETRYLTVTGYVRIDNDDEDNHITTYAESNRSCTVGKLSGVPVYTGTDSSGSTDPTSNPSGLMAEAQGFIGDYQWNKTILWSKFCDSEHSWVGYPPGFVTASSSGTCGNITVTRTYPIHDNFDGTFVFGTTVTQINLTGPTAIFSDVTTGILDSMVPSVLGETIRYEISMSATNISVVNKTNGGCGFISHKTTTATFDFSDTYDFAEVQSYADDTLLGQWDMNKHCTFRMDNYYTIAPLVSTDEIGPTTPNLFSDLSGSYSADPLPNGTILGQPLDFSTHYTPNVASRRHINWNTCWDGFQWIWYKNSYGAQNGQGDPAYGVIPATATQWTDTYVSKFLRPYANKHYDHQVYRVQKWAVSLPPKPSFNYARFPIGCGGDRYLYDESTVSCLSSFDSSSMAVTLTEAQTYAGGDVVYLCGTDFDGGYSISAGSGTSYTLGALVFSSSQYVDPYNGFVGCGDGRIGKLRYPTAPAICGRHMITGVTTSTGSAMTMSIDAQSFLRDGDSVQCVSSSFDGTYAVRVLARDQIAFPFSGSPSYVAKGYIRSTNSAAWQQDDVASKGDYTTVEWRFDYRDVGEWNRINNINISAPIGPDGLSCHDGVGNACGGFDLPYTEPRAAQAARGMPQEVSYVSCSQHCIAPSPCGPSVIVISPSSNSESFANMNRYDMGSITGDSVYGSDWVMKANLWDADYLYQNPHPKCKSTFGFNNEVGSWNEDDGNCHPEEEGQLDGTTLYWYPRRNYYEARCSLPAGAPTPPSGVYIGCLNTVQLNDGTMGNVCPPPAVIGGADSVAEPSPPPMDEIQYYAAESACICANGDFGAVYSANGTYFCDDTPI